MHKDELIQFHTLLAQLKSEVEARGVDAQFPEYAALGVSPLHVHRSKSDHKRAIFILGKELAAVISSREFSGPALVSHRFDVLAHKVEGGKAILQPSAAAVGRAGGILQR